jgi:hypothetical protein
MIHETIHFSGDHQTAALRVARDTPGSEVIAALALPRPRAVLVLNGGTQRLTGELAVRLGLALGDGLARVVAGEGITVVTGGTDAGIFHLFGEGLARWGRTAPCIGVAVDALAIRPGHPHGEATLEPHHSHFVLAEGHEWGDETATMYALIAGLSQDCPSLAVFAGGGKIALAEMASNVRQGRQMIFLAGSGRNTDAVLAVRRGGAADDQHVAEVARLGHIVPFDIEQSPAALAELIRRLLATHPASG